MKIDSLRVENFRRFEHFSLNNLGRVNLLVGTNNSGKTTLLEAADILLGNGDFAPIWATLDRRGEVILGERDPRSSRVSRQIDIKRLFSDHAMDSGSSFQILAGSDKGDLSASATVSDHLSDGHEVGHSQARLFGFEPPTMEASEDFLPTLNLSVQWSRGLEGSPVAFLRNIPINRRGGISREAVRKGETQNIPIEVNPLRFITTTSLDPSTVASLFEEIVLTPAEDRVVEALRIIEPELERLASAGSDNLYPGFHPASRGGILARLEGVKDRIPIGSMGDGIWRMLGLALAAVRSGDGILLIDEIDAGLHHAVMEKMWMFLNECSRVYNIQIIATTHSLDCYRSLAAISREDVSDWSEVTINRIERGRSKAIAYSEQEIVAAAERSIEVR